MKEQDKSVSDTSRRIAYSTDAVLSPLSQAADVMAAYSWDRMYVDTTEVEGRLKGRVSEVTAGNIVALEEILVGQVRMHFLACCTARHHSYQQ